jgi:hypothetical protein
VLVLIELVIACACGGPSKSEHDEVSGYVESMRSSDNQVLEVTIRTFGGDFLTFHVLANTPLNTDAKHLAIHRSAQLPVTLRLKESESHVSEIAEIDDYLPP